MVDGVIDEVDLDLNLVIIDEIVPVLFQEIVIDDDRVLNLDLVHVIVVDDDHVLAPVLV
jgi:hypothetical protein